MLAVVSQHTERVQLGSPSLPIYRDKNSAVLQTLNADELSRNLDQGKQFILAGDPSLGVTTTAYDYTATAWHDDQKRLMAVGQYTTRDPAPGSSDVKSMLISRLKEQPLFADGFEGN